MCGRGRYAPPPRFFADSAVGAFPSLWPSLRRGSGGSPEPFPSSGRSTSTGSGHIEVTGPNRRVAVVHESKGYEPQLVDSSILKQDVLSNRPETLASHIVKACVEERIGFASE